MEGDDWDMANAELCPDIHTLFATYNQEYFEGLLGMCTVEWSDKMTLCAGLCYMKGSRQGRHCVIRLSRPLLQYRPFSDTINTLLHEMIHAHIFIKRGRSILERDGHGPDFQAQMHRINGLAGSSVTVFHTFHEEVRALKRHVWRCQGACSRRAPFYGWVRRAMNRAPQPADWWWAQHQAACGGAFVKVEEPEAFTAAQQAKQAKKAKAAGNEYGRRLEGYFRRLKGTGQRLGGDLDARHPVLLPATKVQSPRRDDPHSENHPVSTAQPKNAVAVAAAGVAASTVPKADCIDLTED
jgi:predicted SprT family Zn-dependent metalloprotease